MNLEVEVQNYDWGKRGSQSYVAQLIKKSSKEINENLPYAELWMGTHPNGPSKLVDLNKPLSKYVEENLECLGTNVLNKFGNQLPYLFKVLSVEKALSIQAHPNKDLATILNASRPDLYKDSNHKPELAIALTDFEALCGFRPFEEIKFYLKYIPELKTIIGEQNVDNFVTSTDSNRKKALQNCFKSLMTAKSEFIETQLISFLSRISTLDDEERLTLQASLIEKLHSQFPNDVGCFVVYFLNHLKLRPDEALYLGPNEPHAYLAGDCVECMACSDNVVRAGLTPKFKDVETLCNMLTYQMESVNTKIFKPIKENHFTTLYAPPVEDFSVAKIQIPKSMKENVTLIPRSSASIIIVINGCGKTKNSLLVKGSVLFVTANDSLLITEIQSELTMFQAFANV